MFSSASFKKAFKGQHVFLTGHTGFKGSWLTAWLESLGASVTGFALPPPSEPSHFELLKKDLRIRSVLGDIRDPSAVGKAIDEANPDLIIHMAAQPIVLRSYRDPVETYQTNVMGTLHVFEAARAVAQKNGRLKGILNITSDKCYENRETLTPYKETDPMGGYDPYSSSKGCAEILFSSYQRSYFPVEKYGRDHHVLMASVRAGNVIGGGDWAEDRLIPDLIRAANEKRIATIRNPTAIRPWQHVLEPLSGYLEVAQRLLAGETSAATGWNFGPNDESCITVGELLTALKQQWAGLGFELGQTGALHEAHFLRLDSGKARTELGWKPVLNFDDTVRWTADWYRTFQENNRLLTFEQLKAFEEKMTTRGST